METLNLLIMHTISVQLYSIVYYCPNRPKYGLLSSNFPKRKIYPTTTPPPPPPSMGSAFVESGEIQMQVILPLPASLLAERLNPKDLQNKIL